MAVKLIAVYSKRLGLPGFSSHQFSVSVETELHAADDVSGESERLYKLLQEAVDHQIQITGFVPPDGYGMNQPRTTNGANGHQPNGHSTNGNGHHANGSNGDQWQCTDGQKGFIIRLVNESKLDKNEVEALAQQLFGCGVKQCSRLQASQLIEELLEKTGKPRGQRWQQQGQRR